MVEGIYRGAGERGIVLESHKTVDWLWGTPPASLPHTTHRPSLPLHLIHLCPELDLAADQILCQVVVLLLQAMDSIPEHLVVPLQPHHRVLQLCLLLQVRLVVPLQLRQLLLVDLEGEHGVKQQLAVFFSLELLGQGDTEIAQDALKVKCQQILAGNLGDGGDNVKPSSFCCFLHAIIVRRIKLCRTTLRM